jgi:hypothetical protein
LRFYGRHGFVVVREYGGCVVEMVRNCVKRWNNIVVFYFWLYIL